MNKAALVGVACFLLGSVTLSRAKDGPACGELPVKYLVCDANGGDCELTARFKDMAACLDHSKRSSWFCDTSRPGRAECDTAPASGPRLASSKCAR